MPSRNFGMGYSQYGLDNNTDALRYFNKAYELNPEDEDTRYFIRQCNIYVPLAGRVERFRNWFVDNEKKLSEMVHPKSHEEAEMFMAFVREGAALISENMNYNIGGDNEFSFFGGRMAGSILHLSLYYLVHAREPES